MNMTTYVRREFRVGDLVILNQTKLENIPSSLASLVLGNIPRMVLRFRVIGMLGELATIKSTKTCEEFNIHTSMLVANFNNVGKNAKRKAVVNIKGVEVVGELIKLQFRFKGKIKNIENGEIIKFDCSKNNLGFV